MDWSNEEYVRLYTRDSDDWIALSWEARSLFMHILRKVERNGRLLTRRGAAGVAGMCRMPADVVARAMPELLSDGCVQEVPAGEHQGYLLPNFLAANEASKSDRLRKRESRASIRDRAAAAARDHRSQNVTAPAAGTDAASQNVTDRHERSHEPEPDRTNGHERSLLPDPDPKPEPARDESGKPDAVALLAQTACSEINRLTGSGYEPESVATVRLCRALVKAKFTPDDVKAVVADKVREWKGTKVARRLCPKTLLALDNFSAYLDELRSRPGAKPLPAGALFARAAPGASNDPPVKFLYPDDELARAEGTEEDPCRAS